MFAIPNVVMKQYDAVLTTRDIPISQHADYKKWLRYFYDFSGKYSVPDSKAEQVRLFSEKLKEKKQAADQCQQAAHAISLFFEMQRQTTPHIEPVEVTNQQKYFAATPAPRPSQYAVNPRKSQYLAAGYDEKTDSPEWDALLEKLAGEIKVRHYSRKTLQTYAQWSRRFQRFLKNKPPRDLSTIDVKEYLTYLAVKCKVAASTQNQAFNSLLFLFRHALKRDFGILKGVPRAKKSLYIPMVLSRAEIDAILKQLSYPYNLVVKVLFGCGLRLFECLNIRIGDFNFDAGMLLAHGKGKKDRTVPIPESILPELRKQIEAVGKLHDKDLAAGYDGVFMEEDIEKKYPKAPKEFTHQWFFPLKTLTKVEETGQIRRYHLHESDLQKALYWAVRRAKIPKKSHRPHFPSFLRYPSVAGQLRHPRHSETAGARQLEDDDDLYPLRSGQDGQRANKSAGSGGVITAAGRCRLPCR